MKNSLYDNIYKYLAEITDPQGKKIDNVKIDDIVRTPDGKTGKYIKKKEYAIIDLGNGQIAEAEIDNLQLIKAAPEEPKEEPTQDKKPETESVKDMVEGLLGDINVSTGDIGFLGGAGSVAKNESEDEFTESKTLYVVGYNDEETGSILYRSNDFEDDTSIIWKAVFFETEEEAQAEIDHESSAYGFDITSYFIKPVKLSY